MAAEHVQFPGYLVEKHAGSVEQVGGAMDLARSAVSDVMMDTGAYGQLCQFLPGILNPIFGLGAGALYKAVDVLNETAANLRTTAANMSDTDTASGQRVAKAGGGTPPLLDLPL